ncbi:hypothetical protein [uncultured Enterovirga sp.]|uniref:hypothetical protein n=1 Tax=uncultured Enterovirga sp. TaxID=2026352 RepID=UPI0035C94F99
MSKFCTVILAVVAAMTLSNASTAQTSSDLSSTATVNSLSAHSFALSGSSKNAIKLNAASTESDIFANAMRSTPDATSAALKGAGLTAGSMNGKLATASAVPASGDNLFSNALPAGSGVSNALKAGNSGSTADNAGGMNAFVAVGLQAPANLGNALGGSKGELTNQRLGK